MRSKEFLIEYDRDKTIEQMGTAIANTAKLTNPRIKDEELAPEQIYALSQNVLGKIESVDPTPNKKYVLWIVRQFVKNGLKLEDINEFLRNDLQDFHELPKQRKQQLGIETDLNKYTWRDLREIATKLKKATDLEEPVDAKLDYEHIDDMKVLYVGDMGQLIIPRTTEASCEIGRGTRWCTAATESDNEFSNYASDGSLYVWIPSRKMPEKKQSNKFQFHFESAQFMDENDEQIESELIRYFRSEHPVLKKLFAKGERVIAQDPERAYSYALDVIKGEFLAGEAAIAQDANYAYEYARRVIKQLEGRNRFPAGEEAIAQDLQLAYSYARYVIGGRFPEGEAAIAQDPEWSYYYVHDVIKQLEGKNRFPAGEEAIAQDLQLAYLYALRVIEGRFPEGEEVLAQDPEWAYYYALQVIKELEGENRFPAGEEAIAQDPEWAYLYARYVIGGRFPEGEAAIARHPHYVVSYAFEVIKELEGENRFPAGEEVIAQDAESAHFYARKVIGGRFPEGEAAIAGHIIYALDYSIRVIKERFPEPHRAEAEATIKKDSKHWKAYVEFLKQSENQ